MHIQRKITKIVAVNDIKIGGGNPIVIQSMCTTDTRDVTKTADQINRLAQVGCQLVRVAVVDMQAAQSIANIKKHVNIPIVADIHFDYRIALQAVAAGADKIRINPGNIGGGEKIKAVLAACKEKNIPIRIGVNSGSLEKDILRKYKAVTPEGLVESALRHVELFEKYQFFNTVISIKSSNVPFTIKAYEILSKQVDYPLHIGVTEAGANYAGVIKSSVGIGTLLAMGIGDTIRVSLTDDPAEEIKCAKEILKSLGLMTYGIEIISCPTCGRCAIDLISIAKMVEDKCQTINKPLKVAVMGCAVNGPGEAKEADVGVAGGDGVGIIFKKGNIIKKVPEKDLVQELMKEIENYEDIGG